MGLRSIQSKKLKTYIEKVSDLIIKVKIKLYQLLGTDEEEVVVPYYFLY